MVEYKGVKLSVEREVLFDKLNALLLLPEIVLKSLDSTFAIGLLLDLFLCCLCFLLFLRRVRQRKVSTLESEEDSRAKPNAAVCAGNDNALFLKFA